MHKYCRTAFEIDDFIQLPEHYLILSAYYCVIYALFVSVNMTISSLLTTTPRFKKFASSVVTVFPD